MFTITIERENPAVWKYYANIEAEFMARYRELFKQWVFETHRYLIRVTPMLSGRLRAGWTGILNKYNQDYANAFIDVTLVEGHNEPLSQEAIREGIALSGFIDNMEEMDVALVNGVPYGQYVEFGTSKMAGQNFTQRALYKAELIAKLSFDDWIKDCIISKEIELPHPKPMEEVAV